MALSTSTSQSRRAASLPALENLTGKLTLRAGSRWTTTLFQVFLGGALSFFGPFLMAAIVWLTCLVLGYYVGWWTMLGIMVLVFVPLQFWTEWRTQGNFLSREHSLGRVSPDNGTEWLATAFAAATGTSGTRMLVAFAGRGGASGLVELMLWGPRQCLQGLAKLNVMRKLVGTNVDRAAEVLQFLLGHHRGVPLASLLKNRETQEDLVPILAYLTFHEWIGLGAQGNRIWALTETRTALGLPNN